jgi:beta-lactamase superfamily II metal-dependent hydrolase
MSSSASGAQVVFLDIGQGDSTLVRLPNGQHMLVDVYRCPGEGTVDLFKVLRDCLSPGESGRQLLDYLVITHAHDDHIWGLGDLAEEFDIGELWIPQYGTKKKLSENYDAFVKVVEDQRRTERFGRRAHAPLLPSSGTTARCRSGASHRPATSRLRTPSTKGRRAGWSTKIAVSTASRSAGSASC